MICNFSLLFLFGMSICFFAGTVESIVNGGRIIYIEFSPQHVSVQTRGEGHVCGGGIIGQRFILTAAHCVLNRTRHLRSAHLFVLVGTNNLNRTGPPAVTIPAEKIFFPKEFHPTVTFSHGDIAVLKLRNPLGDRYSVKIKLPRDHELAQSSAIITGFGWNEYHLIGNRGVGSSDGSLRVAVSYVLANEECEESYPHGAIESDVHICADIRGYGHSPNPFGVCHGDTGASLVNGGYAIGVLSRIPPHCDEREKPAVYTRVAHYAGMIHNVMKHGRDPHMIELSIEHHA